MAESLPETAIVPKTALNEDTGFLKIVAVVTMLVDHIGAVFFPGVMIWRLIGRIAFPIFAYCLVVGCLHTRDMRKHLLRLLVFAVISQPAYILNFYGRIEYWHNLNIMFTLFFGAGAVYGLMDLRRRWWMLIPVIAACVFLALEYGTYGVVLIAAFYVFRNRRWMSAVVITAILAVRFFSEPLITVGAAAFGIQGFAVLAMPFIYANTDLKLKINKYFFYAFYPAHLLVIFAVARML